MTSSKKEIHTNEAPEALGTYSQAIVVGNTVYLAGQIALQAETMTVVPGDFKERVRQVYKNLQAVMLASGGTLADIVKLNVYLTDLKQFSEVNEVMAEFFQAPFPARALIGVASLPKGVDVEMDGVAVI